MGFQLRCVIVPGHDSAVAAALRTLPAVVVRELTEPFVATIAAQVADDVDELRERNPTLYLPAEEDDDNEAAHAVLAIDGWLEVSRRFPAVLFGWIYVDCFGGTCIYSGQVRRAGEHVWHGSGQRAHLDVFERLGLPATSWYFAPFTRDYFDGGAPPEHPAQEITCVFKGTLTGALGPLTMAAMLMPAPWRITIANSFTLVVVHGDELALSCNLRDGELTIGGRSHIDRDATVQLLAAFADEIASLGMTYAIELTTFEGALIRTFET
jgi:hypothetical protein